MRDGAIGDFTVAENLVLVDFPAVRLEHDVDLSRLDTPTRSLSKGDQYPEGPRRFKFSDPNSVAQPTRGVDIGAAEYIHAQLLQQRADGKAILLISEDLDEVLQLSDRVLVLLEGKEMGTVDRAHATVQEIGLMMTGSARI